MYIYKSYHMYHCGEKLRNSKRGDLLTFAICHKFESQKFNFTFEDFQIIIQKNCKLLCKFATLFSSILTYK